MIKLKIGRTTYDITNDDIFMDNGACVQLITQKAGHGWASRYPVLSKRAVKEINKLGREKIDDLRFRLSI
jgi:hypothetical protein